MIASTMEPGSAATALELLESLDIPVNDELGALLLTKDEKSGNSKLIMLLAAADAPCTALVTVLCSASAAIKSAVKSVEMFAALAKPKTAAAALQLIEKRGLAIDDKLLAPLLAAGGGIEGEIFSWKGPSSGPWPLRFPSTPDLKICGDFSASAWVHTSSRAADWARMRGKRGHVLRDGDVYGTELLPDKGHQFP